MNPGIPNPHEIQQWFIDTHMIKPLVRHQHLTGMFFFEIWQFKTPNNIGKWDLIYNHVTSYKTYMEALTEALKEAEELIK